MTAIDTAKAVLAKASLLDQSFANPDLGIAVAWAEILRDTNPADAVQVVATHYATETRRIMPADVLAGVRRIRDQRLREFGNLEPDYDKDDVPGGIEAIRRYRRAVGDGDVHERPRPLPGKPCPEEVTKMLEGVIDRMPRMPDARPRPNPRSWPAAQAERAARANGVAPPVVAAGPAEPVDEADR